LNERVETGRLLPRHNPDCFACGVDAPASFGLEFELLEGGRVAAEITFEAVHSGAPGYAHGGAIATALDDVIGTLLLAVLEQAGVTARLEVDYRRPILIGETLRLEAWLDRVEGRKAYPVSALLDGEEVAAEAHGLFVMVTSDHFLGQVTPAEDWLALRAQGDPGLGR
jgi:acyl-coenzyme A thioesterase PaaI-like protein